MPFLLELVADPGTPDRAAIVGLLGAIAIGYDSTWLPVQLPIAEHREASGQYGPRVPVPADADAATRLAGFMGRDPGWAPATSD